MKSIRRVGKQQQKYVFTLNVCDVRGLPAECTTVAVSWQRGDKIVHSPTVTAQGSGGSERGARIDAKLTQVATLYARNDRFDPKLSTLRVVRHDASGKPVILGHAELDLAEHAPASDSAGGSASTSASASAKQVRQILMQPPKSLGSTAQCLVQLSVAATPLSQATGAGGAGLNEGAPSEHGDADSIAGSEGSHASAALTHEAIAALEASQTQSFPRGGKGGKSGRFNLGGGGGGGGGGGAAAKAAAAQAQAQAAQLLADAQADARQAEQRLSVLQHRLRVEVLQGTEELLEQASGVKSPTELARKYLGQLQLVLDQVDRIAYDDGGAVGGGGGISSLEAEVMALRRDLAAAKVELAEVTCEKAELEHVARRLNKQLAEVAAQSHHR